MTNKRYAVANWKSNKSTREAETWLTSFLAAYRPDPNVQVIIAPSFIALAPLLRLLKEKGATRIGLAAQDISPFPAGSYTGAVTATMLKGLADYAFVGHAERRRYFHETHQEIANKVSEAASAGITPILCLDRPYAAAQLAALAGTDAEKVIIGYGPVEAIGIDMPQSAQQVSAAIQEIRARRPNRPILYGGSVNGENAAGYMQIEGISGVMAGSASLDPQEFARICAAVARGAGVSGLEKS